MTLKLRTQEKSLSIVDGERTRTTGKVSEKCGEGVFLSVPAIYGKITRFPEITNKGLSGTRHLTKRFVPPLRTVCTVWVVRRLLWPPPCMPCWWMVHFRSSSDLKTKVSVRKILDCWSLENGGGKWRQGLDRRRFGEHRWSWKRYSFCLRRWSWRRGGCKFFCLEYRIRGAMYYFVRVWMMRKGGWTFGWQIIHNDMYENEPGQALNHAVMTLDAKFLDWARKQNPLDDSGACKLWISVLWMLVSYPHESRCFALPCPWINILSCLGRRLSSYSFPYPERGPTTYCRPRSWTSERKRKTQSSGRPRKKWSAIWSPCSLSRIWRLCPERHESFGAHFRVWGCYVFPPILWRTRSICGFKGRVRRRIARLWILYFDGDWWHMECYEEYARKLPSSRGVWRHPEISKAKRLHHPRRI